MKQAVADQTPTPVHISRRHTDPPFLWISLIFFSFSLHVFVLQLLFGSQSGVISPQQANNPIPIELLELPPQLSTTPSKSPQDSQASDGEGIDFGNTPKPITRKRNFRPSIAPKPKPVTRRILPTQKQPLISRKPEPTPTQTFTPKPTPIPTFTPKPTPTQTFTPKPTPIPTFTPKPTPIPTFTPKPTPIPTFTPQYPDQPGNISIGKETPLPTPTFPSTPTPTTPPNLSKVFTASYQLLTDTEQRQIISRNIIDKLPQVSSGVQTISIEELKIEPRQFKAILSISNKGDFVAANIPRNEVPAAEKGKYLEIVQKIFRNAKFVPGSTEDGIFPQVSEMVVQITIESTSKEP